MVTRHAIAGLGLTVSDALRILLTRTAKKAHFQLNWSLIARRTTPGFVALEDTTTGVSDDQAEAQFAAR